MTTEHGERLSIGREADRPTRVRWMVFVLACSTSWMLYLHRYMFGLIKPKLVEEFELGETELGMLDSAFTLFYSWCQVPMGLAVDSLGVHLILTAMIIIWCVGLGLHAWAPRGEHLWYGRVVLGAGQAGVFAALSRVTRSWYPRKVRATVQGWVGVFFGRMGGLSAYLLVGAVIIDQGGLDVPWRDAIYGLAATGIVFSVVFAALFRNSPGKHPLANEAEAVLVEGSEDVSVSGGTGKLSFRKMFRRMSPRSLRNLFTLNLQTILSTMADNIFSAWIPLFLYKVHGLEFRDMSVYSALPLLGGACGGAFGGWLNDFMLRRTGSVRWARTTIGLAGKGMAAVVLAVAMLWYDDPYTFCSLLFVVKFFSDWSLTTTWGAVTDIGGRTTATVFAFNNSVASLGGIPASIIFGAIAEHASWRWVFLTGAATYLLCALSWLAIDCRIPVIAEEHEAEA